MREEINSMKEQEVKPLVDNQEQKMLTMDQKSELQSILNDFISDKESEFNKQITIGRARYIIAWIDSANAIMEKL